MIRRSLSLSLCRVLCLSLLFTLAAVRSVQAQTYTKLHDFGVMGGSPNFNSLIFDAAGSAYGLTPSGGANFNGMIFKIKPDGTFYDLHNFTATSGGMNSDGTNPNGSLTLSSDGKTLYGMTNSGGAGSGGIVFSIGVNGNGFLNLHNFTGSVKDGQQPYGSLTLSSDGKTLYGMTELGGLNNKGIVFSLPVTGGTLTDLHDFGSGTDGAFPTGDLTLSADGGTLDGMTNAGGTGGSGLVFSIGTARPYTLTPMHNFSPTNSGANADGAHPQGSLALSSDGGKLYGMAYQGGTGSVGLVFNINTAAPYTLTPMHNFTGSADGAKPQGSPILNADGSTLYGMTNAGGTSGYGLVFSVGTASPYTLTSLHDFTGGSDGSRAHGSLTLNGINLYGMDSSGGSGSSGVIFSLPLDLRNPLISLHNFGVTGSNIDGSFPQSALLSDGGSNFYGAALGGGASNAGQLFAMTPTGTVTSVHDFAGAEGKLPTSLVAGGSRVYIGACQGGGSGNQGTAFKITLPAGTTAATPLNAVVPFTGLLGSSPLAATAVIGANVLLGGLVGGANNTGTLAHWNTANTALDNPGPFSFPALSAGGTNSGGAYPTSLLPVTLTTLYGAARKGANGTGALYEADKNNGVYTETLLAAFDPLTGSTNGTGANPQGAMIMDASLNLYGVAVNGGRGTGTLWMFTPGSPGTLTALYKFSPLRSRRNGLPSTNLDGAAPVAGLTANPGFTHLYGVTSAGGQYGFGTVFDYDVSMGTLTPLYSFGGVFGNSAKFDGQTPAAPLTLTSINGTQTLLGTTSYGGQYGQGTAFSITGF